MIDFFNVLKTTFLYLRKGMYIFQTLVSFSEIIHYIRNKYLASNMLELTTTSNIMWSEACVPFLHIEWKPMWKSTVLRKNVVLYKKIFFKRRREHAVTILFITLNIFPREELQRPVWRQRQFHILVLPCAKTNLEDDFHETCFTFGTVSQFHTDGASRPQWHCGYIQWKNMSLQLEYYG